MRVTFTTGLTGVGMAYGNDRDLMAWLFDKAISNHHPQGGGYRVTLTASIRSMLDGAAVSRNENVVGVIAELEKQGKSNSFNLT